MSEGHGGKREGAGRPAGSKNQRTVAVLEHLDDDENNPVLAILRVMKAAEKEGDIRLAADCAKSLLPYYLPKQRPSEHGVEDTYRPIIINSSINPPGTHWGKEPPEHLKND